jgi:hypothetical protein
MLVVYNVFAYFYEETLINIRMFLKNVFVPLVPLEKPGVGVPGQQMLG